MIDTGCQVTILSTTVFEHMCVVDSTVHSELRPCCRRLAIVFPGLCCDMLFGVANIGSDGLLGTEALQSYLPHQLEQRLTPELDGFLTTSVVIPPDSEIVANFLVSGIRPNG